MRRCLRPARTRHAFVRQRCAIVLAAVLLALPPTLSAQGHDHATAPAPRDARLALVLGGPHLLLYHSGYLALRADQVAALQPLRRAVCDAERAYVTQSDEWRARLAERLDDASRPEAALHDALAGLARVEATWLTALQHARRDALALLTGVQRAQAEALRDHWVREAADMIADATRPGQRGHPGLQLPIRVPAMVVGTTTLLPYCEALHGPASHLAMPPPR